MRERGLIGGDNRIWVPLQETIYLQPARKRGHHIENSIARAFLSLELLAALRLGQFPDLAARLRPLILSQASQHQKGVCDPAPKFGEEAAIVQFIRSVPDIYELWAATEIGERWERPTVFENEQTNKGYWF